MIRRDRIHEDSVCPPSIQAIHAQLLARRRFLIAAAGGSLALTFGSPSALAEDLDDTWRSLSAVLSHLLPDEPGVPGADEIHALDYFRFVTADRMTDAQDRRFILAGTGWLNGLALERHGHRFESLGGDVKEALLRDIVRTSAGENWVATLLTYLFEALLTAPAYGGNPNGAGWRWLEIVPGFPLPKIGTRYMELPL